VRWWAVLIAAGCGGDGTSAGSGTDFPRACDQSQFDGDCVRYTGSNWVFDDVVTACEEGGDLLPDCPAGAAVGTCTLEGGTPNETVTSFYSPFWTVAQAANQCQGSGGSWEQAR
jgi:hypothetical protein